jgi:outer membrane protein assembly factor BamB
MSRRILIASGVLGLAIVVWALTRPVERFITGISALDADHALVVSQHHGDEETRFFVQKVSTAGATLWVTETTPFSTSDHLGFSGVTSEATRVFLLGDTPRGISAMALDAENGNILWERLVAENQQQNRIGPMLFLAGNTLLAVHTASTQSHRETLTALDKESGNIIWPKADADRRSTEPYFSIAIPSPGRIIAVEKTLSADGSEGIEIDAATGKSLRKLPIFWSVCATPRGAVGLGRETGPSFIPHEGGTLREPILLGSKRQWTLPGGNDAPCGVFGDTVIFGLAERVANAAEFTVTLVAFDMDSGDIKWRRDFPGAIGLSETDSADGRLPRIYPVISHNGSRGSEPGIQKLTVIDLQNGNIVREAPLPDTGPFRVFATSQRAFIQKIASPMSITAFDPASGDELTDSPGPAHSEITRDDFRFGRLWVSGGYDLAGPEDLPFQVIDLESWQILHTNGSWPD